MTLDELTKVFDDSEIILLDDFWKTTMKYIDENQKILQEEFKSLEVDEVIMNRKFGF